MFRIIPILVIASLLLAFGAVTSQACSCIVPWTPTELLDRSDLVTVGRVTDIAPHSNGYDILVSFATHAVWKGPILSEYSLMTSSDEAMCGYTFLVDETYLVYADDNGDGNWFTHLCGRNAPLMWAEEDLAELGPPLVVPSVEPSFGMVKAHFGQR